MLVTSPKTNSFSSGKPIFRLYIWLVFGLRGVFDGDRATRWFCEGGVADEAGDRGACLGEHSLFVVAFVACQRGK